ncbi:MAG: tryptophan--tRNA ligase [Desulfobacteraceae bacterium]
MKSADFLTGITTTGTPHLGNFVGAIRPAVETSTDGNLTSYYFLADYHSIIKCQDPERVKRSTLEIAASWIALGLDTGNCVFYRQSDVPEILELAWILTCLTPKGLLNRAHAYKAAVDENQHINEQDLDRNITMGLFCYPVLMAADILMFNARKVPVGRDQTQHLEMTRDIASRFNHNYQEVFRLPRAVIDESSAVLAGLDGRKMSKSYNNTIPLFESSKKLRKSIMKIKTNSQGPDEPKDYETCTLFSIYNAFAGKDEAEKMKKRYQEGIAWGTMKQELFEYIDALLDEPRKKYNELINSPGDIHAVLKEGSEKARSYSAPFLKKVKDAVGIHSFI